MQMSLKKSVCKKYKALKLFFGDMFSVKIFSILEQKCKKNVDKYFWSGKFNY